MCKLSLLLAFSILCHPVLGFAPAPSPSPSPSIILKNLTDSLHITVNAAIREASNALDQIKQQQTKSGSDRESTALSDCSKFYEQIIESLKKTLEPDPDTIPFDVQIWLSGAATCVDNCETSIAEMNITQPAFLETNNALKRINDALAINAKIMKETGDDEDLYRWLPDEDYLSFSELGSFTTILVAKDGSGKYRTIKEALDASRSFKERVAIHIKQGIYNEYLEIGKDMKNLFLIGDGIGKTIITGDRSAKSRFSTSDSPTVKVFGEAFVARDITFRNTAGVDAGQAVALLSSSDKSAYYRCSFEGYQDTLWVASNRQFYRECKIYGTIDFIFGDAIVVIENSFIYARAPLHGQAVVITAQARQGPHSPTGISIINSKILPDPSQKEKMRGVRIFLGRPWRSYARVVFMESYLDGMVDPAGWMEWRKGEDISATVYYGEYQNYGPGSSTSRRVHWRGVKVIRDVREAKKFSLANFLAGLKWLPRTGVPFFAGV